MVGRIGTSHKGGTGVGKWSFVKMLDSGMRKGCLGFYFGAIFRNKNKRSIPSPGECSDCFGCTASDGACQPACQPREVAGPITSTLSPPSSHDILVFVEFLYGSSFLVPAYVVCVPATMTVLLVDPVRVRPEVCGMRRTGRHWPPAHTHTH